MTSLAWSTVEHYYRLFYMYLADICDTIQVNLRKYNRNAQTIFELYHNCDSIYDLLID